MGKNTKSKSIKGAGLLLFLLLFSLPFFVIFSFIDHHFDTLPYYGTKKVVPAENGADTLYYQLPDFELTDQNGDQISSDSLKQRIYLATFFNTRSPYISKITKRLLHANFRYRNEPDIALVCITTDPIYDTPQKLKEYTSELKVADEKFYFLTSPDSTVIDVISNAFLTDDYANSSRLWLVDTEGHLRGKYNGNKEEEIQRALEDIALLKKELDTAQYEEKKANQGS